jgi:hypothetical protein
VEEERQSKIPTKCIAVLAEVKLQSCNKSSVKLKDVDFDVFHAMRIADSFYRGFHINSYGIRSRS